MKRMIALTLIIAALLSLCACGKSTAKEGEVPTILNTTEYVLYQNIFFNDAAGDYVGEKQTKTGTFTMISDSYNDCTRYYVWGYNDQTKCCDWQWEFVPADPASLPAQGCLVEVEGTFAGSDNALDGYWLEDAVVTVKTPYEAQDCDLLLTTMGDTLERVQVYNIIAFPENYEGKTIRSYGRIASPTSIEDPYYDGSWTFDFSSDDELPAIGTIVVLDGVCQSGTVGNCTITETTAY